MNPFLTVIVGEGGKNRPCDVKFEKCPKEGMQYDFRNDFVTFKHLR